MAKRINIISPINGGTALGLMTAAGNPWTVSDELANELVNRRAATYVDAQPLPPVPVMSDSPLVSGAGKLNSLTQMLTIVCGNSISALNRYTGTYWAINGELHIANMLAGAPMRFGRLAISGGTQANWNASATGVCDVWGVYGYSGKRLDEINLDIETNWLAPIITAGNTPQLIVGHAMLENDIAQGATVAQMTARLKEWLLRARRWPGARVLLCTPRPSFSYNTPALVAAYQAMRDYTLTLDDGGSVFVARLDGYENPAAPATPLAGYTDASVHPNTAGAFVNARVIASTLKRIALSFQCPFRLTSNNFALIGAAALNGTNVSGTGPTSASASGGASGGAQTITGLAEQPGWLITVNQVGGQSVDAGTINTGSIAYVGGAGTQLSAFAEIEIVSGADQIRWIDLAPRINDGGGNNFQQGWQAQTGDVDGAYQNGDVLTISVPPQVAASGTITALQPYLRVLAKTGGSGTIALASGQYSYRIRRTGALIVAA